MKISNSKKELARIISENGGWRSGDYASQHGGHGGIGFSLTKPERWGDTGWDAGGSFVSKIEYKKPIKNWHQTILYRAEYFHLYPEPYAKHEFCESVMRSIPEPENKPTIEQLAADCRNAKGYADRKQKESDAAKAYAEAKLAELVAAGKALGLALDVADAPPVATKFTGKFHSAKYGDRPSDLDMICDGCGKRFGHHVGFDCRP